MGIQHTPKDQRETPLERRGNGLDSSSRETQLPSVICIASNDGVWAGLLVQNLAARGASTTTCDLRELRSELESMPAGSWVVVDGGWPMFELQSVVRELNELLRRCSVSSVMIVDELVGSHPLADFEPDHVLKRTPHMPELVRHLLTLIAESSSAVPVPALRD